MPPQGILEQDSRGVRTVSAGHALLDLCLCSEACRCRHLFLQTHWRLESHDAPVLEGGGSPRIHVVYAALTAVGACRLG